MGEEDRLKDEGDVAKEDRFAWKRDEKKMRRLRG